MPKPLQDTPQGVPVSAPPSATKAPAPTETKSCRKVIVGAIAASFTVGLLFGCCAASVVFWTFPRVQGVLPQGIKGAVNKATGMPKDDMTFQDLEGRLNAGNLNVSRSASSGRANTMWFGEGLPAPAFIEAYEDGLTFKLFGAGHFRVTKYPTAKEAEDSAAQIIDMEQKPAFSWGPFVFEGKQDTLDNVKAALANKPIPHKTSAVELPGVAPRR